MYLIDKEINMLIRVFVSLLLLVVFSGCKKQNADYQVRLNLFSGVPGPFSFTVAFGEQEIETNLIYNQLKPTYSFQASTNYFGWKLNPSPDYAARFLTDLPNGSNFTFLFYDSIHQYKVAILKDDWRENLVEDQSIVRFIPMIIGTGSMQLTNDTNRVLLANRSFGDFLLGKDEFFPVDTMLTKLRLYTDGQLLDSIPNQALKPNTAYTIYGVGVVGSSGDSRPRMIVIEHE